MALWKDPTTKESSTSGSDTATAVAPEPAPGAAKPDSAVPELRHDSLPDAGAKPA